jgi:glutaredoxin
MITIYGVKGCDYCVKIKKVCNNLNIKYEYKDISITENYNELKKRLDARLEFPSIFHNDKHIGWYTDFIQYIDKLEKGDYNNES